MATIPPVADGDLILTSWGNLVANELNNVVLKETGATAIGTFVIDTPGSTKPLALRNGDNTPYINFESQTAATLARITGQANGLIYDAFQAGDLHLFHIGGVERVRISDAELSAPGLLITGKAGVFGRGDNVNQLFIIDTNGGGVAGRAFAGFYPSGTDIDTPGARGGYVGFNGDGCELKAELGALTVQSLPGNVTLECNASGIISFEATGSEFLRLAADQILIGKTTGDADVIGTTIFCNTSSAQYRGQTRSTIGDAAGVNLYLRHIGGANANGKLFVDFTGGTGTRFGSITQEAFTGVHYNETSDYRLKDVLGPIDDPVGRVQALAPKHLRWKTDQSEFDGFLAHEVQAVVPQAVTGAKDAVLPASDEFNPGAIDPQQLDTGQLVPLLTAALQQALSMIEDLTTRITALEGGATT